MNQPRFRVALIALPILLAACGAGPEPLRARAADPSALAAARPGQPLIIEFQEGDVIPLRVTVGGPLAASDPEAPPVVVRARQRFFLRIDGDRMAVSLDGEHFGKSEVPGKLSFGLGVDPKGPHADLALTTPTPAR